MTGDSIRIDEKDNVAVTLTGTDTIPAGHKFALTPIRKGEFVIKYGQIIGRATEDIPKGAWVHTHNMRSHLDESVSYSYHYAASEPERETGTFLGYLREDGSVGIRNEIFILPTVGCVNGAAMRMARAMQAEVGEGLDGVYALTHQFGCSQLGEDAENIRKLIVSIACHPNAAFVLLVGLGCENNALAPILDELSALGRTNVCGFNCQEVEDEQEYGLSILRGFAEKARAMHRTEVSLEKLKIGVKCGGSDGYSGITANPTVGKISDRVVALGGAAVLTEVPEMFGAETILMNRCANEELFHQTVDLINDFKNYFKSHNQTIYENPSPGNKKGGISTLEDKSLGCTQKSGSALVKGVLQYGDTVKTPGLNLLSAPGNDLVAATALAAAGAHIVLFTTGRGTPFASPVPTMKIATNSRLAGKKSNWIDFNAGVLVEDKTMEEETKALFDLVVETASGKQVCSEAAGFHDMAIFKQGVTL